MFYSTQTGNFKELDTPGQSVPVDVFCNQKLLGNILDVKCIPTLYCNARKAIVSKKEDLKGDGMVGYHPEGFANILSLQNVQKIHKVTYDRSQGTGFVVHKVNSTSHVFMPSSKELFFSDVKGDIAHVLINTVDKNKSKYTVKQYADACKARLIQDIISRSSITDYIKYIENDEILNCPITKDVPRRHFWAKYRKS